MPNSQKLWHIETPDEELDRLEAELIEMELARGFDFNAAAECDPCTPEQLREQAIAEFNEPELDWNAPEWLDFIKDMDDDDVEVINDLVTPVTH